MLGRGGRPSRRSPSTGTSSPASPTTSRRGRAATAVLHRSAARPLFVLSTSGHIAAIVNLVVQPGRPPHQVLRTSARRPGSGSGLFFDGRARGGLTSCTGSAERSGPERDAPALAPGGAGLVPLDVMAPGTYVLTDDDRRGPPDRRGRRPDAAGRGAGGRARPDAALLVNGIGSRLES
ncbi:hypothetical protein HBB16_10400 [Pseudonocardia sp. MCCB 268]|nr:hypothetical protein [Pseudonocardia cytotoxica]